MVFFSAIDADTLSFVLWLIFLVKYWFRRTDGCMFWAAAAGYGCSIRKLKTLIGPETGFSHRWMFSPPLFFSSMALCLLFPGGTFVVTLGTSDKSETMTCRLSNNHR